MIPGTRLGVYEVTALIGEGGMGQVFRARDTRLNRDVALKVLPDSFADDAERLAWFTREAPTLAALNHPNIAHLHGLEESGGVTALVMELIEGEDLSAHLVRGPMPFAEELFPVHNVFSFRVHGKAQRGRQMPAAPDCDEAYFAGDNFTSTENSHSPLAFSTAVTYCHVLDSGRQMNRPCFSLPAKLSSNLISLPLR